MSFLAKLGILGVGATIVYGAATGQFNDIGSDANQATAHATNKAADQTTNKAGPLAEIPADYLALYRANAGKCKGVDAPLLAAMGFVESRHGTSKLPGVHSGSNRQGAKGPLQFKDATWAETRGFDPSIGPDVYNPANAIPAAATYVCHYAASKGVDRALSQYGGAGYLGKVKPKARAYRTAGA